MKLAITICATKSYQYALEAQARCLQANLAAFPELEAHLILVTDESPVAEYLSFCCSLFGDRVQVHHVSLRVQDGQKNYQSGAQLLIAQMRTAAFTKAIALGVDYCWSLDSDVLPPSNALACMLQVLDFDGGYYGIATCPYPSQGGGGFLFGRGTITKQIAEDVYEDEREIPDDLNTQIKEHREKLSALAPGTPPDEEWRKEMKRLEDEVKQCKPRGNVFELNSKRWRLRGWGDAAYPALGRGAIVPTDWCGFGCTLMSREALLRADFTGYEGQGTEDLFICWHCWYPAGLRLAAIPHCLCHHVIRNRPPKPDGYTLCYAHHETEGECVGHIRLRHKPWYSMRPGEAPI